MNKDYALRWAAENGQLELCKLLLKHGADIDDAIDCTSIFDSTSRFRMRMIKNEL